MNTSERKQIKDACRSGNAEALVALALRAARRIGQPAAYRALRALDGFVRLEMSRKNHSVWLRVDGRKFELGFNPDFTVAFFWTGEDVLHALLHELLHRLRSDPQRATRHGLIGNFASDLLVNKDVYEKLMGRRPTGFLRNLYPRNHFPENILLPPDLLLRVTGERLHEMAREDVVDEAYRAFAQSRRAHGRAARIAAELYADLWRGDVTYDAIVIKLSQFLSPTTSVRLLGSHGPEEEAESGAWASLREVLRGLPGMGTGKRAQVEEERTRVEPVLVREFAEAIRRALGPDPRHPHTNLRLLPDRGVVPYPGRREVFLLAAGVVPVLYPNPLPLREFDEMNVRLYLDVSYSTKEAWPWIFGMIAALKDDLGEPFYLFSNAVREISFRELMAGSVRTTGGTDFDCVALHALERRFKRILVVTDGVGQLNEPLATRLKEEGVSVFEVLTETHGSSGLEKVTAQSWRVPRVSGR